jgi:hypothetical protein
MCLIVIGGIEGLPQNAVVIDFSVDGEGDRGVIVDEGLGSRVYARQSVSDMPERLKERRKYHTNTDDT